jgi:Putative beta-barrel porin 2
MGSATGKSNSASRTNMDASRTRLSPRRRHVRVSYLALIVTVSSLGNTRAQNSEVEPTPIPSTTEELTVPEPQLPIAAPEPVVTINNQPVSENVRRFRYHFTVTVRTVYDDNININSGRPTGDFYTSFEPSVRLSLGDPDSESNNILQFVYAPNVVLFANHSDADAVQHIIHLEGRRVFGRLTASLSQDIQMLNGSDLRSLTDTTGREANIDVGARTQQNIYTTKLAASYDLSAKTFLSGGVDYSRNDYATLISSRQLDANLFINYNYSPKLVVGLGTTLGYNETDGSTPTQHFEQINLRATFNPGEKLSLSGSAGFEFRQFESDTRGTYISPVFDLTASYKPFDGTTISLAGFRRTQNSAVIAGSDFTDTNINFTVQQRFLQRIFLSLSAGYENAVYLSTFSAVDLSRSDDYYYLQVAIDCNITRYLQIGLYYLHREDISTLETFTFSDSQFGLRSSLIF